MILFLEAEGKYALAGPLNNRIFPVKEQLLAQALCIPDFVFGATRQARLLADKGVDNLAGLDQLAVALVVTFHHLFPAMDIL